MSIDPTLWNQHYGDYDEYNDSGEYTEISDEDRAEMEYLARREAEEAFYDEEARRLSDEFCDILTDPRQLSYSDRNDNDRFVAELMEQNPAVFEYASDRIRADRDMIRYGITCDPDILSHALITPEYDWRKDRELLLDYLNITFSNAGNYGAPYDPVFLAQADASLLSDQAFMLEAIDAHPLALIYASETLKDDQDFNNDSLRRGGVYTAEDAQLFFEHMYMHFPLVLHERVFFLDDVPNGTPVTEDIMSRVHEIREEARREAEAYEAQMAKEKAEAEAKKKAEEEKAKAEAAAEAKDTAIIDYDDTDLDWY